MVYIILILIAIILVAGLEPLSKMIKVPFSFFLILFGVLASTYGVYDFFEYLENINSSISEIAILSKISLEILFLIAGLSLSQKNIKKTKQINTSLTLIPTLIEWGLMSIITYFIINNFSFMNDFSITFIEACLVMSIFAMSTSIVVIPKIINIKESGKKDIILDQVSFTSVVDNFILIPIISIFIMLIQSENIFDINLTMFDMFYNTIIVLVAIVASYFIGYIYGYLVALLFNKLEKNNYLTPILTAIIILIGSLLVIKMTGLFGLGMNLITAFAIGIAFDSRAKTPAIKIKAHKVVGKIYLNVFMPIIFIYIGVNLKLNLMLNLSNLLIVALLILLAVLIKTSVATFYLKIKGYNKSQRKVTNSFLIVKGVMLFYYIALFSQVFVALELYELTDFMNLLATVALLITYPISVVLVNKNIKEMQR